MERKKIIGFGRSFSLSTVYYLLSTVFTRFTLYTLLFTVFMLLYALPPSAVAADKLVVTASDGQTKKFVVTDTGNIGIGNPNPAYIIDAIGPDYTGLFFTSYRGYTSYIVGQTARGTSSAPLPTIMNNNLLQIAGRGYNGTSFSGNSAHITFKAAENWSASANGTYMVFFTTPEGTTTQTEKMRITGSGYVGIGTTDPQGKLDVNGAIYQRGGVLHADYVFNPAYKMESIEEHANFMWNNKHLKALPGVQKDENGAEIIEIGADRRGIVEELEKAHIYIEQLNKRLQALEAKLQSLEK
jgi:hypothetical protein